MKILHMTFDVTWSWTEIAKGVYSELANHEWTIVPSNKFVKCGEYDIVFLQQVLMLSRVDSLQKTVTRIGTNSFYDEGRYDMNRYSDLMSKCYAIIATNNFIYEKAKALNKKVYLIPNGLDLEAWKPVPLKKGKFVVGFVGNIKTENYKQYKGYHLLEKACANLGVELKTALYGEKQIPHNEMRDKFYSKVSCIVHPTQGEGCSNTIMEALACGLPVITTREAGFHGEMLTDDKDVLFCERTVEDIEAKIAVLRGKYGKRRKLAKNGRIFAEKNHDIKVIAKQYDKVFKECYEANKNQKEHPKPETVTVRVKRMLLEDQKVYKVGDVFTTNSIRASRLRGFVDIIKEGE